MMRKRVAFLAAGMLALASATGVLSAKNSSERSDYSTKQLEFYLSEQFIAFIRPGLEATILDVSIPSDRRPEVRFMITDPKGQPLDRDGIVTPGPVSTSFILSYIPEGETAYVAYTTRVQTSPITGDSAEQATSDSGGEYTMEQVGTYVYKFGTELPADYPVDATHTLGMYARRDLTEFELDRYVDNALEHFVPSGSADPVPRDIVTTETCNGRCHDPLAIHGGSRQEVGLCVLCHNATQDIDPDTGSSIYMPNMIHKIHAGEQLTNGYTVIGFRQSVHDYSEVVYPGIVNDCEACHTGGTTTADFPLVADPATVDVCNRRGTGMTTLSWDNPEGNPVQIFLDAPGEKDFASGGPQGSAPTGEWVKDGMEFFLMDRVTGDLLQELQIDTSVLGCNGPMPGASAGEPGMQHTNWLSNPNRVACGSCHDHVDFATGEGHSEFDLVMEDDTTCYLCHVPDSGNEFDRSIRGAHTVEYKSNQLGGVLVQIDQVRNTGPGQRPIVNFWLSNKWGLLNPADLGRLRWSITGPNEDFDFYTQEESVGSLVSLDNGLWSYQFDTALPADASGSYSIGVEGRIEDVVLNPGTSSEFTVDDPLQNFIEAFAVTDAEPMPRSMIVDGEKCNACHNNLSFHGGNRHNPQYCVTCHRPDVTDSRRRPEEAMPAESVHFKYMIHKIHRGADLENGYVAYGFGNREHDYSEIHFTGDLRNCDKCHVDNSQQLPLPAGRLATVTPTGFMEFMEPETAACLSCHDGFGAAAHAAANTGSLGETCATCHGEDKAFSVDYLHAR